MMLFSAPFTAFAQLLSTDPGRWLAGFRGYDRRMGDEGVTIGKHYLIGSEH